MTEANATRKDYRIPVPGYVKLGNRMTRLLLRAGINIGSMRYSWLLTVRGRKSGQPRTTPVSMLELDGKRYLFTPYGAVDWVRNLRAAGEGMLQHGRRLIRFTAHELSPQEGALVMRQRFNSTPPIPSVVRQFFTVTPDSTPEEFEQEAARHPVFEVREVA